MNHHILSSQNNTTVREITKQNKTKTDKNTPGIPGSWVHFVGTHHLKDFIKRCILLLLRIKQNDSDFLTLHL